MSQSSLGMFGDDEDESDREPQSTSPADALPDDSQDRESTTLDSPKFELPAETDSTASEAGQTPADDGAPAASSDMGIPISTPRAPGVVASGRSPASVKGSDDPEVGGAWDALNNLQPPAPSVHRVGQGGMTEDQLDRQGQQQDAANEQQYAHRQAGLFKYLHESGLSVSTGPDGQPRVDTDANGAPVWQPVKTQPYQNDDGDWVRKTRDSSGQLQEVNLKDSGEYTVNPKTGDMLVNDGSGQKFSIGKDQPTINRLAISAQRVGLQQQNQADQIAIAQIHQATAPLRQQYTALLNSTPTVGGVSAGSTVKSLEQTATSTDPAMAPAAQMAQETLAKFNAEHPEYAQAKSALAAAQQTVATKQAMIEDRKTQALILATNPNAPAVGALAAPNIQDPASPGMAPGQTTSDAVQVQTAATAAQNGTTQLAALPQTLARLKAAGVNVPTITPAQLKAAATPIAPTDTGFDPLEFGKRILTSAASDINGAFKGAALLAGNQDIAQFFRSNQADLEHMNNPDKDDLTSSKWAKVIGATLAGVPGTVIAGALAPEAIGIGAVGALAKAGRIAWGAVPLISQFALGASGDAFDAAKQQGQSDDEAKQAAATAGWKITRAWPAYLLAGAVGGAAEGKIISKLSANPELINPFLKGVSALFTHSVSNVAASSAVRAYEGEPWQPTMENIRPDIAFAGQGALTEGLHQAGALATGKPARAAFGGTSADIPEAKRAAYTPIAQAIIDGKEPSVVALDKMATDPKVPPAQQAQAKGAADLMRYNAQTFIDNPVGQPDPSRQYRTLLSSQDDLQGKYENAPDEASKAAIVDQTTANTAQMHGILQDRTDAIPDDQRAMVGKSVDPTTDVPAVEKQLRSSAPTAFAAQSIGSDPGVRAAYVEPGREAQIQKIAERASDPAAAARLADQHVGMKVGRDLWGVVSDSKPIDENKRVALEDPNVGLLVTSTDQTGAPVMKLTHDALPLLTDNQRAAVKANPGRFLIDAPAGTPQATFQQHVKSGEQKGLATLNRPGPPVAPRQHNVTLTTKAPGETAPTDKPIAVMARSEREAHAKAVSKAQALGHQVIDSAINPAIQPKGGLVIPERPTQAPSPAPEPVESKAAPVPDSGPGFTPVAHSDFTPEGRLAAMKIMQGFHANAKLFSALGIDGPQFAKIADQTKSGLATAGRKLVVDGDLLHSHFQNLGKAGFSDKQWVPMALDEELTHRAQIIAEGKGFQSTYEAVRNDPKLDPELVNQAREAYAGFDDLSPAAQGAEITRMVIQGRAHGTITERMFQAIEKFVNYLKGLNVGHSELLESAVKRAEGVLEEARGKMNEPEETESEPSEPSEPKEKAAPEAPEATPRKYSDLPDPTHEQAALMDDRNSTRTPAGKNSTVYVRGGPDGHEWVSTYGAKVAGSGTEESAQAAKEAGMKSVSEFSKQPVKQDEQSSESKPASEPGSVHAGAETPEPGETTPAESEGERSATESGSDGVVPAGVPRPPDAGWKSDQIGGEPEVTPGSEEEKALARDALKKEEDAHVEQFEPAPEKSVSVQDKSAADVLHTAKKVKMTVPKGTSFIRVTDRKGRRSVEPLSNVNKGANPFRGAGPFTKVEAGTIGGKKGREFIPMDVVPKAEPLLGASAAKDGSEHFKNDMLAQGAWMAKKALESGSKITDLPPEKHIELAKEWRTLHPDAKAASDAYPIPRAYLQGDSFSAGLRGSEDARRSLAAYEQRSGKRSGPASIEAFRAAAEPLIRASEETGRVFSPKLLDLVGAQGGEHRVTFTPGRVLKFTEPDTAGGALKFGEDGEPGVFHGTLPEYLKQIETNRDLADDDTRVEGIMRHEGGAVSIVSSQKSISGNAPEDETIAKAMRAAKFVPVDTERKLGQDGYEMWFNPETGTAVTDGKPANFVEDDRGDINAIDLKAFKPTGKALEWIKEHAKDAAFSEALKNRNEGPMLGASAVTKDDLKNWPGDRVTRNPDGTPKTFYHGSKNADELSRTGRFDNSKADPKALYGPGFYFTDDAKTAGGDGDGTKGYSTQTGGVVPAHLDVRHPFNIDADMPDEKWQKIIAAAHEADPRYDWDYLSEKLEQRESDWNIDGKTVYAGLAKIHDEDGKPLGKAGANELLKKIGYDGITHIGGANTDNDPHRVVIAFDPHQIVGKFGGVERKSEDPTLFASSSKPDNQKAFESAVRNHGTTDDTHEAGYVLPDGRMLDFSGRAQTSGYQMENGRLVPTPDNIHGDMFKGERESDHRTVKYDGQPLATEGWSSAMRDFMDRGAMRVDGHTGTIDLAGPPTAAQENRIRQILERAQGGQIDLQDGDRRAGFEANADSIKKVVGRIRRFYRGEGIDGAMLFASASKAPRDLLDRLTPRADQYEGGREVYARDAHDAYGDHEKGGVDSAYMAADLKDPAEVHDQHKLWQTAMGDDFKKYLALTNYDGSEPDETRTPEQSAELAQVVRNAKVEMSKAVKAGEAMMLHDYGEIDDDGNMLGASPAMKAVKDKVDEFGKAVKALVAPPTVGTEGEHTALLTRENVAELAARREQMHAKLKTVRNNFDKMPVADRFEFMRRMELGQPQATPALDGIAKILRQPLDDRVQDVRALGTGKLQQAITNYLPHIWKDSKEAEDVYRQIFSKKPLEGSGNFLKKRSIPTIHDGMQWRVYDKDGTFDHTAPDEATAKSDAETLGGHTGKPLEPISTNPVDLVVLKVHEIDRYVMAHRILNEMKSRGLASFVPATRKAPDGWQKIDDKIGTVMGPNVTQGLSAQTKANLGSPQSFVEAQTIRGHYYAPEDAARIINNYLSPGLAGNMLYDAVRATGNHMNMVQLGLSGFHATGVTINSVVSRAALAVKQVFDGEFGKALGTAVRVPLAPYDALMTGSKVLKEMIQPGSQGADIAKLAQSVIQAGGRGKMDSAYQAGAIKSFFDSWQTGSKAAALLKAPFAALEALGHPLMAEFVPRIKLGVFADAARYELGRMAPGTDTMGQRKILANVWDSIDNRFGQLAYDNLFWSKTLKDIAMIATRSVGWNLGTVRELGGGAVDALKAPYNIANGQGISHRLAYTVALPATVAMMGALYQYLHTGKGPDDLKDYFAPRTGRTLPDGTEERINLPTYMKDMRSYGTHPFQTVGNKIHPLFAAIAQMIANKDYFGTQIIAPDDPVTKKAASELKFAASQFVPFSIAGGQQRQGQTLGAKAESFAGITPAPAETIRTPAMQILHEYHQMQAPNTRTSADVAKFQIKSQLMSALRPVPGKTPDITPNDAVQRALKAGLSIADAKLIIKESREPAKLPPFKSVKDIDVAQRAFDAGTPEEKALWAPTLMHKRVNAAKKGIASAN